VASTSDAPLSPETINRLEAAVPPALAFLAGMQLEIFSAMASGPRKAADIAVSVGAPADRIERLLRALVLTDLVVMDEDRFANSAEAAAFLVKGEPGYVGGTHELTSDIWFADMQTAKSVRSGRPAAQYDFSHMETEALTAFLRGLRTYATKTGAALAETFDFSRCGSVIDIGGGSGAALFGLIDANPSMRGTLFELAPVAEAARPMIAETNYADRISIEVGDILASAPAGRHDAALLRAVVQVLGPEDAAKAIANACQCLSPGGSIYITGAGILDDGGMSPASAVYLDLTLMNFYPQGASRTVSQHFRWLSDAGCTDCRATRLKSGSTVISAIKA